MEDLLCGLAGQTYHGHFHYGIVGFYSFMIYRPVMTAPDISEKALLLEAESITLCYASWSVIQLPSILLLSRERHQAYPVSTGRVHIQSGTDAYAPLDFHPGYLDESVIPQISMIRPLTESLYQGG